jgi:hypothetical protein
MDEISNLLILFHFTMVKAIDCIVEFKEYSQEQSLRDAVGFCNYYHWRQCSFLGVEAFDDIKEALSPEVKHIGDYINFLLGIPKLKHFLYVEEMQSYNYAIVSFHMSLACFNKFNSETWYLGDSMESKFDPDVAEAVCLGPNTGVFIEQDALELQSRMKDVEQIDVNVPAGEHIQDPETEYYDAAVDHNMPLDHDGIQDMYIKAQESAGAGNHVMEEAFTQMSALQAIKVCHQNLCT